MQNVGIEVHRLPTPESIGECQQEEGHRVVFARTILQDPAYEPVNVRGGGSGHKSGLEGCVALDLGGLHQRTGEEKEVVSAVYAVPVRRCNKHHRKPGKEGGGGRYGEQKHTGEVTTNRTKNRKQRRGENVEQKIKHMQCRALAS
ncbi:hypothetical protein Bbelb_296470 [Branchiostoma belcheri]|nr:hypothetical protein Bbelb_296470 [Branchiostoma belcheri]